MTREQDILLYLVKLGIGGEASPCPDFDGADWNAIMNISTVHGVSAIALDGLQKVYLQSNTLTGLMSGSVKYEWLGQCLSFESEYSAYEKSIRDLAGFYNSHGIRMLLLKGYGMSLNYPIPAHRPVGDIDTYNFGMWRLADQSVEENLGIRVDRSHHHHTVFSYRGYSVENHYDFINTKAHKDAPAIEQKLKKLAEDSIGYEIDGVNLFLPSATFNAIFLMRHAGQHFAAERLTLRQLLDWGLFLGKHSADVNWEMVVPFMKEIGLWNFCCVLNSICVSYLGMDASHFPGLSTDSALVDRVVRDILSPEFDESKPEGSNLRIVAFKARRWWYNRWKHPLVYKEWWLPMLLTLAWSHLRHPEP